MARPSIELIRGVPLFADLDDKTAERLANEFVERHFDEGAAIATEGTDGLNFFIVSSGEAAVTVQGSPVGTLGPGDSFGEVALVDKSARSATVTATSGFARALIAARAFVTTVTASSAPRLDIPMSALNRIISGAPDYPITTPTKAIAGITRNAAGAALGSCTVRLVRQSDNVTVASATSNASTGAYSFVRDAADPNVYFVIAFLTGAPEVHGVTDRGLVPA